MPKIKGSLLIFPLILVFFFLFKTAVFSETMSNTWYKIIWGNFNMASGNPSNTSYKVTFTAGQTAPGLYTGTNYKVKAGFQYVYTLFPFSFSITNHNIDFGIITPANPVTRTSTLSVNNKSAGGFIVTATESGQLSSPATGGIIPDTTCDSGTCTEVTAGAWVSSLAYGFGYRCDLVSGLALIRPMGAACRRSAISGVRQPRPGRRCRRWTGPASRRSRSGSTRPATATSCPTGRSTSPSRASRGMSSRRR